MYKRQLIYIGINIIWGASVVEVEFCSCIVIIINRCCVYRVGQKNWTKPFFQIPQLLLPFTTFYKYHCIPYLSTNLQQCPLFRLAHYIRRYWIYSSSWDITVILVIRETSLFIEIYLHTMVKQPKASDNVWIHYFSIIIEWFDELILCLYMILRQAKVIRRPQLSLFEKGCIYELRKTGNYIKSKESWKKRIITTSFNVN